jgi:two-component system response regulator
MGCRPNSAGREKSEKRRSGNPHRDLDVYAITMETTCQRSVILAVDDDDDDIDLMRLLFHKAGVTHPVEIYRQGEDLIAALTTLVEKSPHLLPLLCFLDVKMPSINGHELLRWIREKSQFDRLAVVMLSSSEHPEDVKQAAVGGAQCYLAKYPHPTVLKQVLDEAERVFSSGARVSSEWFGLSSNLLLRWGLSSGRTRPAPA